MGIALGADVFEIRTSVHPGEGDTLEPDAPAPVALAGVSEQAAERAPQLDDEAGADWTVEDILFVGDASQNDAGGEAADTGELPSGDVADEAWAAEADAPEAEDETFGADEFVFQSSVSDESAAPGTDADDALEQVIVFECDDEDAAYEALVVDAGAPEQPAMPHDQGDLL